MTSKQKKQELKKIKQLYEHIISLQEKRASLWAQSYSSPAIERAPAGAPGGNRIEKTAEAAERIEREIKRTAKRFEAAAEKANLAIKKLPDERQRVLMRLVYCGEIRSDGIIHYYTLFEAAEKMCYGYRNIKYLHSKALKKIAL